MYTVIDLSPFLFGISFMLLCVFMFACGVIGTLIGIAVARVVLRVIDREAIFGLYNSYHERQRPIEHRQYRLIPQSGETHGCTPPARRTCSGNLSQFRQFRITGDN